MSRYTLRIEELMLYGRIGTTAEEQAHPQRLLLSAALEADLRQAAASADVAQGICYAALAKLYEELVSAKEWTLVEELADVLARETFERFPLSRSLKLTIKKFAVPNCHWVGVESFHTRESF